MACVAQLLVNGNMCTYKIKYLIIRLCRYRLDTFIIDRYYGAENTTSYL